jgi:ABC-type nitrate/sulfonate/bicarbonate transport system substrate-binding protein
MTKKRIIGIVLVVIVLMLILIILGLKWNNYKKVQNEKTQNGSSLATIRIGWQIPWAVEGQLTQILKHTSLLSDNGLVGEFKGFSSGAPLNEAALAGDEDVIFTADQPAATLLSKSSNWVIIGRLMYNRVSLYVPPLSPIKSTSELKGKTVAIPFGTAAQKMTLGAEQSAGLNPQKDVKNINLGIYEQSDMVRDPKATKWGNIDAMAGFDPTPSIFEDKGLVRNLQVGKVVSVIVMSKKFINENPSAPVKFLKAFYGSYYFYRNNIDQANKWFIDESHLNITPHALEISASLEPNLDPTNKIIINFSDDDYKDFQDTADFIYAQKLINKPVIMKNYIDTSYVEQINNN